MKLTAADKRFIVANITNKSVSELSEALGKPEELILEHLRMESIEISKTKYISLRQTPEWVFLSEQYDRKELQYIEKKYTEYCEQLDSDIEAMERKQLLQMIETDVMMQRNKIARKLLLDQIVDLQDALRDAQDVNDTDSSRLIQQQLAQLNQGNSGSYRELVELQKKHDDLMRQLDATREQRLKSMISTKYSWKDVFAEWLKRDTRLKQATLSAIQRKAMQIETERLSAYHTYSDGELDQPLLNIDTVKDDHVFKN